MYYKVEAYRASERAGAILYAQNITPTYVSDNPVLNSQHVVFEAAKAYGHGLPYHAALAGVTSAPAELLGLGNRVGKVKSGFDADIVVWDSDPLSVGATPVQVWIDGAAQLEDPIELKKPVDPPKTPNTDLTKESVREQQSNTVIFTGISHIHHEYQSDLAGEGELHTEPQVAVVTEGKVVCVGSCKTQLKKLESSSKPPKKVSLTNGYLTPPLTSFGTALGLQEIDAASETHDGPPPEEGITLASLGVSFGGKQLAAAASHGVLRAISAPVTDGINSRGVSVGFRTNAAHPLEKGAIWKDKVALHYPLTLSAKSDKTPSISSAIQGLTFKLLDALDVLDKNDTDLPKDRKWRFQESTLVQQVVQGGLPLVLSAHSADTIAAILRMKSYVEAQSPNPTKKLNIVIIGGAEAHLLAPALGAANMTVVLAPLLPHAQTWDQRRGLTGPPLTPVATNILLDAGVTLGISVEEMWEARDLGLLAGIAWKSSEGRLSIDQALDMVGRGLESRLGIERSSSTTGEMDEWVIWEGNPLEIGARIRGMSGLGVTDIWV